MVNTSDHGVAPVLHYEDYYIRGGDVTFHVENYLFRVHRHFFERESVYFSQILASNGEDAVADFDADIGAYTLHDVTSEDFARFLWVFYNPKYRYDTQDIAGWLAILKLANRWGFMSVKGLAIRELEKLEIEPVERICIYKDNGIDHSLLLPSYTALCKRKKLYDHPKALKLDMETVLHLSAARERAQRSAAGRGHLSPTSADASDEEMTTIIMEEFGLVPYSARSNGNGSPVPPSGSGGNPPQNGPALPNLKMPEDKKAAAAAKAAEQGQAKAKQGADGGKAKDTQKRK
ncbi:hypothetical protein BV22DRAFT_1030426 [Leucogyrophana mollusca]|uniref:Uncharacterized protein n=1 Tax=Leucogyrophana mollusca TaxID=85980 RepID=A0ACB8BRU4_9AGAM|nr:hypothetical protein BV22DRAFT_1030426 [Leucogyrophana mollusca]